MKDVETTGQKFIAKKYMHDLKAKFVNDKWKIVTAQLRSWQTPS